MKNEEDQIDFENSIAPWLGVTSKIIDYYFQEELNANNFDLSKEQMVVLKKLHDKDGLNQNELAYLTLRNKSSLTRLLTKMEGKNYISRRQSRQDKRNNHVYLTDTGKEIFKKAGPIIHDIMAKIESNISETERNQIISILKKIQYNFTAKEASLKL